MRIALTIPSFDVRKGGAEGFAARTVKGLRELGHEVRVFSGSGDNDDPEVHAGPLSQALALIAESHCDVHIDWGLNVPADLHRLGGGIHKMFTRYNTLSVRPLVRPYKRLEQLIAPKHVRTRKREAKLLKRPEACFLAVSDFVAEHLEAYAHYDESRIFTLVNGVPVDRFSFHCRIRYRKDIRRVLGLDDANIAFLFVANNPRLKNLRMLTHLFREFHHRVPTARLVLMGRHNPKLNEPWAINAGQVTMPERIYSAADVLLHPTFFDACANVVLEAMACGCPVLSSDCNGSAQVIAHGKNGYVLPVTGRSSHRIEKAWFEIMMALCEDPHFRRRMGRAAASLIRTRHTMETYVADLEKILLRVRERKQGANTQPPRSN